MSVLLQQDEEALELAKAIIRLIEGKDIKMTRHVLAVVLQSLLNPVETESIQ